MAVDVEALVQESNRIASRLQELGVTSQRIATQYEANMSLYNVAAMSGDKEGMEKYRTDLHSLLDHLLDVGQGIGEANADLTVVKNKFLGL